NGGASPGPRGAATGRATPAAPRRPPAATGAARAHAAILIGDDHTGALSHLPGHLPILRANLAMQDATALLAGRPAIAFAGIGRPEKFFDGLREQSIAPAACVPFADHHPYTPRDLHRLRGLATTHGAALLTTPKDAARLPATMQAQVLSIGVGLAWSDPATPERLLDQWLAGRPENSTS
ncbi:MAG: tetraacyldisaccharide 4'-kinase, partial [Gluconacetobacter sp.]